MFKKIKKLEKPFRKLSKHIQKVCIKKLLKNKYFKNFFYREIENLRDEINSKKKTQVRKEIQNYSIENNLPSEENKKNFHESVFLINNHFYHKLKNDIEEMIGKNDGLVQIDNLNKENLLKYNLKIKKRSLRVGFLFHINSKWCAQSLYEAMLKDEDFQPIILLCPTIRNDGIYEGLQENVKYLIKHKMHFIKIYNKKNNKWTPLESLNLDLLFYQQPHDYAIYKYYKIRNAVKLLLTLYIPYGYMMIQNPQNQFNHVLHRKIWKIFSETDIQKKLAGQYCAIGNMNVESFGYPKLDAYLQKTKINESKIWKLKKSKTSNIKRIIWAPHHSVNGLDSFGTFHMNHKFFKNLIKKLNKIDWVIKPHPILKIQTVGGQHMTSKEYDKYFNYLNSLPNSQVYTQGGYFDIFKTSDAMILDSISFLAEYLPTKRPMLFINNPNRIALNEFGERIMKGMYIAHNEKDIENFINEVVIKGNDYMYEQRMKVLKENIHIPPEGAGEKIKNYLKNKFFNE